MTAREVWDDAGRIGASVLGASPGPMGRAMRAGLASIAAALARSVEEYPGATARDRAAAEELSHTAGAWTADTASRDIASWSGRMDAIARRYDLPTTTATWRTDAPSVTLTVSSVRELVARRVPQGPQREAALAAYDTQRVGLDDARREVDSAAAALTTAEAAGADVREAADLLDAMERAHAAWWSDRVTGARATRWQGVSPTGTTQQTPPTDDGADDGADTTHHDPGPSGAAVGVGVGLALVLAALAAKHARTRGVARAVGGRRGR